MEIPSFEDRTLRQWIIPSGRFDGKYCPDLHGSTGLATTYPITHWQSVMSQWNGILSYTAAGTSQLTSARNCGTIFTGKLVSIWKRGIVVSRKARHSLGKTDWIMTNLRKAGNTCQHWTAHIPIHTTPTCKTFLDLARTLQTRIRISLSCESSRDTLK
jgi:hypothetical protein